MAGDPLSAFGSVLGLNRAVDAATAEVLCEPGLFVEAIVAPDFDAAALEILTTRPKWKANVRLMKVGDARAHGSRLERTAVIDGGALVQEADVLRRSREQWKVVTETQPTDAADGRPAFRLGDGAAREVERHRGVQGPHAAGGRGGPDEPRRFGRNRHQEGGRPRAGGSVLASDAFFPFPDSIEPAAAAGMPRDDPARRLEERRRGHRRLQRHGIAMIFTGRRHFKH